MRRDNLLAELLATIDVATKALPPSCIAHDDALRRHLHLR